VRGTRRKLLIGLALVFIVAVAILAVILISSAGVDNRTTDTTMIGTPDFKIGSYLLYENNITDSQNVTNTFSLGNNTVSGMNGDNITWNETAEYSPYQSNITLNGTYQVPHGYWYGEDTTPVSNKITPIIYNFLIIQGRQGRYDGNETIMTKWGGLTAARYNITWGNSGEFALMWIKDGIVLKIYQNYGHQQNLTTLIDTNMTQIIGG
jgi:hypothetical protein